MTDNQSKLDLEKLIEQGARLQQLIEKEQQRLGLQAEQINNQQEEQGTQPAKPKPKPLPRNMRHNKLFTHEIKNHVKRHETKDQQTEKLIIEINELHLNSRSFKQGKRAKSYSLGQESQRIEPKPAIVVAAIMNVCDLSKDDNGNVFIYDADTHTMVEDFESFKRFVQRLTFSNHEKSNITINDPEKFTKNLITQLRSTEDLRPLKKLPSFLVATKNGLVIDLKTKAKYELEHVSRFYDILSKSERTYIDLKKVDKERRNRALYNREIVNRVLNFWGDKVEGIPLLLKQFAFAAIEGWNREKIGLLKGAGGNGKSTYMEMMTNLVGEDQTAQVNIHQWGDPNIVNMIHARTHLIIGDDAPTNAKLGDAGMSNLKSITTGQTINLPVKYGPSKWIRSTGLYLQGTNTDVRIFENSEAIKSRIILITWNDTNWRDIDKSTLDYNLSEMKDDPEFLDDFFSMTVDEVEYFETYDVPDELVQGLERMIEDEDVVQQVLNDIEETCDGVIVPFTYAYEYFKLKSKRENPGSAIMKSVTFSKRLRELAVNSEIFSVSTDYRKFRNGSRDKLTTKTETCRRLLDLDYNDAAMGGNTLYLSPKREITAKEIQEFKSQAQTIAAENQPLTPRQDQVLDHLMHTMKDTEILSLFKDSI